MKRHKPRSTKQIIEDMRRFIRAHRCATTGLLKCPPISLAQSDFDAVRKFLNRGDDARDGFYFEEAFVKPIKEN